MPGSHDYMIIKDFIGKFLSRGYAEVSRLDPEIITLEKNLNDDRQFFYIADLLQMRILFVSSGSRTILGVDPDQWSLSTFFLKMYPGDSERYSRARAQLIKEGYSLLIKRQGISVLSSTFRVRSGSGNFINLLFQGYSFFSDIPHPTVFTLLLLTDLSSFTLEKHGYHYYLGDDPSMFRYPNDELLKIGHIFSDREFEIIKLIAEGLGSEQIADKLFLSVNTVNTHRRNILKKTNKSTTHDLVIELQESGIL